MFCPVCRGACNCKTCTGKRSDDGECEDLGRGRSKINDIHYFHYMICLLLPVLKQFNQEQTKELELESKIKGKTLSEVYIPQVVCDYDEKIRCDGCGTSIVDFHRSCSNCPYEMCINCCQEIRHGNLPRFKGKTMHEYPNKGMDYMHGGKPLPEMMTKKSTEESCSLVLPVWQINSSNGSIYCGPKRLGGCGNGTLDLKCVFPRNWAAQLESSADEVVCCYDFPETLEASQCFFCMQMGDTVSEFNLKLKAAAREGTDDNFLYCPTVHNTQNDLEHFQKHWSRGHPVIVRNVLQETSSLSWDPVIMLNTYLAKSVAEPEKYKRTAKAIDCLDGCQVDIGIQEFLNGYLQGRKHSNNWPEMLILKDWPPSPLSFQEVFPSHSAEFINGLPFQAYTNPESGLFNLVSKMPAECPRPNMGPHVHISYGIAQELGRGDSVAKLFSNSCDVINVLLHTSEVAISPEQLEYIKKLKKKHGAQNARESLKRKREMMEKKNLSVAYENIASFSADVHVDVDMHVSLASEECKILSEDEMVESVVDDCHSKGQQNIKSSETYDSQICSLEGNKKTTVRFEENIVNNSSGARWNVFRREDVPKLCEYLRKHSKEFRHIFCAPIEHVGHPILDQCFFLDSMHIQKLKEEFKIEPWTFNQHLGEAVMVPAGCPYQIKNLKSCVNVELDFVSPENVSGGIQLIEELRLLPDNHKAKEDILEVKKLSVFGINAAMKGIYDLTGGSYKHL